MEEDLWQISSLVEYRQNEIIYKLNYGTGDF